jgi:outer membrane lipoprotein-sorting protein
MGENKLRIRALVPMAVMAVAFVSGCAMSEKTAVSPGLAPVPLKTASKAELIDQYNQLANSVTSLNASVTIQLTSGSNYSGVVEQYHEVTGFILAQKPSNIRVIGQVPIVGKNIFDMQSDGATFHIFVPSKSQFLVGSAALDRPSAKPIENLRPQHLLDAIFWEPISKDSPVLFEETTVAPSRFYVLTVVRAAASGNWEIDRKIWFSRADLNMTRLDIFDPDGSPNAIIRYSGWGMFGSVSYPHQVFLDRPVNDYQLQLTVAKLTANETIEPERFALEQPPDTQLIRVGEDSGDPKPAEPGPTEPKH